MLATCSSVVENWQTGAQIRVMATTGFSLPSHNKSTVLPSFLSKCGCCICLCIHVQNLKVGDNHLPNTRERERERERERKEESRGIPPKGDVTLLTLWGCFTCTQKPSSYNYSRGKKSTQTLTHNVLTVDLMMVVGVPWEGIVRTWQLLPWFWSTPHPCIPLGQ